MVEPRDREVQEEQAIVTKGRVMKTMDAQLGKREAQLKLWGAKLDELVARAERAGSGVETDFHMRVDALKTQYQGAQLKLDGIRVGGVEKWESIKADVESTWHELDIGFKELTKPSERGGTLLWTTAVICILLWALGLATSITLGGFIHVLVFMAVALLLVRIMRGRRLPGGRRRATDPSEKPAEG